MDAAITTTLLHLFVLQQTRSNKLPEAASTQSDNAHHQTNGLSMRDKQWRVETRFRGSFDIRLFIVILIAHMQLRSLLQLAIYFYTVLGRLGSLTEKGKI